MSAVRNAMVKVGDGASGAVEVREMVRQDFIEKH